MPKLSALIYLSSYSDATSSNNPSLSNFKWAREFTGIPASNPVSAAHSLAPGESKVLFNGTRTLSSDNTTAFDIALKPLSTQNYRISWASGTKPDFRTPRALDIDATSQITAVVNGPIVTFTGTGGTLLDSTALVVGDYVRLGTVFNILNQGEYKVLAKGTNSFTVENQTAVNEGPITLGSQFADQLQAYSAVGVQVGDTLVLSSGFSAVSLGSYKVTDVAAEWVEFYTAEVLPVESGITNPGLAIYSAAKQFIYLEADQKLAITVNGSLVANLEPFIILDNKQPGVFMLKSTVYSLAIQNSSTDTCSAFVATIE